MEKPEVTIIINGNNVPLDELKRDVIAARERKLSHQWTFTPETVDALINKIEELSKEILTLREVVSRGR